MPRSPSGPESKLLSHAEVDAWMGEQRAGGRRVGFTCGSFDILHAGHAQYLARAREQCDRLLVAVNSDDSVRRYKSPLRPVNPQAERLYVVASLASVDAVTILDDDRPLHLLLRWKPDLYIKGGDYRASSLRSAGAVEGYGGRVLVIGSDFPTSTSAILERASAVLRHATPDTPRPTARRGLVLLDRDGTLIRDVPFLGDPSVVELLPGVGEGLAALQAAGFALAIVTNQQGIGLGYSTTQQMIAVNQRIFRMLAPYGVRIARVYYCPHSAADECACRKPADAMVRRAIRDFAMDPAVVFLVGDLPRDAAAGRSAGCRTVLVGGGPGDADYRAVDFADAARWIANQPAPAPGDLLAERTTRPG